MQRVQFAAASFRWGFEYRTFLQKMFSMTKLGRFVRGFSVVEFLAVGFLEVLETLKTQRQKPLFLYKSGTGKAMRLYGLISKLMVLLIKEEFHRCNVQLL